MECGVGLSPFRLSLWFRPVATSRNCCATFESVAESVTFTTENAFFDTTWKNKSPSINNQTPKRHVTVQSEPQDRTINSIPPSQTHHKRVEKLEKDNSRDPPTGATRSRQERNSSNGEGTFACGNLFRFGPSLNPTSTYREGGRETKERA